MSTYDKEYIARYLDNDLDATERTAFEESLRTDAALVAEVALYREALSTLQQRLPHDATAEALRNRLQQLNKEHFTPAKVISFKRYLPRIVAAAAVLIIAVIAWWPQKNYLEQYGDATMVTTTERGNNNDSLLQQAAVHFNNKEFKKALPLLSQAVAADSSNQLALFYRGLALVHTGEMEAARKDLEKVYAGESILRDEAALYIALSYTEQKNKNAAKEWLKKVAAGSPVGAKAEELLKKLE